MPPNPEAPDRPGHGSGQSGQSGPAPSGQLQACKDQMWAFAQQSIDHAILLIDTDNRVTWASPGAVHILGADATEMVDQPTTRFFTPEDVELGIHEHEIAVARSGGSAEDDRWMMRADGSRFWAAGLMVALHGSDGEVSGFIKILRDQTDLKMQMETLRNRAQVLDSLGDTNHRSIATLAHELRNPLASLSMASAVLRQLSQGDARLEPPLDILERNLGFAARLVDDLEGSTRTKAGKLDLKLEGLLLQEMLQDAIQTALHRAGDSARDVDLLPPSAPVVLIADPDRIRQVFVNLIGNAIKFTAEGGRIWVKATLEGPWVVVRVEDDGAGIAPEMLERIFEMFTQADPSTARVGLGIGLSVVKDLVELHGGSVQAHSEGLGKGSKFSVRLPLRQSRPDHAGGS
ncbi:PAS domain-containing sensor histidine kinase [Lysobacter sp. D1-1-M9]|uniref:PAS domain-containing sensor histidine kinase n=2 Tax=Novilysobacter TaxID=3382699 RepID=UPI002FC79C9F